MFGLGVGGFEVATDATVRDSSFAVPASTMIVSPAVNPVRLAARIPVAPAAEATLSVVLTKRSAPVSKLYAMTPRLYQCSSALLPAAEYRTSAIGPVRSGRIAVLRTSLIRLRILEPAAKKYFSTPMFACTASPSPRSGRYAPGAHMK